jgi:hypothetical protein
LTSNALGVKYRFRLRIFSKDFTPKGVFNILADIFYKDFMPKGIIYSLSVDNFLLFGGTIFQNRVGELEFCSIFYCGSITQKGII